MLTIRRIITHTHTCISFKTTNKDLAWKTIVKISEGKS